MILPVACCGVIAVAAPRLRAVRGGPDLSRILWVGAHPDDEALVAPLLGMACVDGTSDCALLVVTRGENGSDGNVRTQEMVAAAALLRSRLTQWTLPDVMQSVNEQWNRDALVAQIANVIESEHPSIVMTFDPNHGSSCHPAHRVLGSIVADAATISATPLYFVETFYTVESANFVFRDAVNASSMLLTWDVSSTWHFLVDDARTHASQFTPQQVDALTTVPPEQRRVWLMPASAAATARDSVVCR